MSIGYTTVDSIVVEADELEHAKKPAQNQFVCPWYGVIKNSKEESFKQNPICSKCDGKDTYEHPKYEKLNCPTYSGQIFME